MEDGHHMSAADVETLASAAVLAAFEADAAFIVVLTVTGKTAAQLAKYRPPCTIFCAVVDERVARQLQSFRGAHAVVVPAGLTAEQMKRRAVTLAKAHGIARAGDRFVTVHGACAGGVHSGLQVSMSHVK